MSKKPQEPLPDFMPGPDQHATRRRSAEAAPRAAERAAASPKPSRDRRAPKPATKRK